MAIIGCNLTIENSGTIGNFGQYYTAIVLTGGVNSLTALHSTSGVENRIEIRSGASLSLHQDTNDTLYGWSTGFIGDGELIKTGAAKASLSNASGFTGTVRIDEGTLVAAGNSVFAPASQVTVNADGTLDLANSRRSSMTSRLQAERSPMEASPARSIPMAAPSMPSAAPPQSRWTAEQPS